MGSLEVDTDVTRAVRSALAHVELRKLPWRERPCEPWAVLVAETMLIQTQAPRVAEVYPHFLARFGTPAALWSAGLVAVLEAWSGLGYYRRAERLWRGAGIIVERWGGECPREEAMLRTLPGVGRYVARAVAVQCGGLQGVPIDTNARRVLVRAVLGAPATERVLERAGSALVEGGDADRLTQAIFDVGAQWCRARPRCSECPLEGSCRMCREGLADPWRPGRPQGAYEGSLRQVRARVLRVLLRGARGIADLEELVGGDAELLWQALDGLRSDGLVEDDGHGSWRVPQRPCGLPEGKSDCGDRNFPLGSALDQEEVS